MSEVERYPGTDLSEPRIPICLPSFPYNILKVGAYQVGYLANVLSPGVTGLRSPAIWTGYAEVRKLSKGALGRSRFRRSRSAWALIALAIPIIVLSGCGLTLYHGNAWAQPPPIPHRSSRIMPMSGTSVAFNWNTKIFSLPGFNPMKSYFPSVIYPGTGYQVPTLSAAYAHSLGIYYVNNNSDLVEFQLVNNTVRTVAHVVLLYQLYPSYGTALYGMLDDEFFIDSGYGDALFFGTTTSSGSTYSIELVNLTTGQLRMRNTTAAVDGTNQQVQYVGNETVVVMSSNCSIYGFNLASHLSWYSGKMGASFSGTCFEANNIYWIPQKGQLINVEAHGSSGDQVEQLNATYNAKGQILFTSVATITVDTGVTYNWVNGLASNASSDRIAFSAGYWGASTVYTYDLGYSRGLITTSGEVRYSVVSSGVNTGEYLDIQRYVFTSNYIIGWGKGNSSAYGGSQYLFDPWNGSTILANLTINNGNFGNQGFEGLYDGTPDYLIDFNATVPLNSPMYKIVYAYHGAFTAYPGTAEQLTPANGPNRTLVAISGVGYAPGASYNYCWTSNGSAAGCPAKLNFTATSAGLIPAGLQITRSGGTAWLAISKGTQAANFTLSAKFTVSTPKATLSPPEGPNRSLVGLAGSGLAPDTTYDYCTATNGSAIGCAATHNFTTDDSGQAPGNGSLTWTGSSGWIAVSQGTSSTNWIESAQFNVTRANLTLGPGEGPNGTLANLTGSGFGPGATYDYCWTDSASAIGCGASENFTATTSGTIPNGTATTVKSGGGWLAISQGSSSKNYIVAREFNTTVADLSISPGQGPDGTRISVDGSGFAPGTVYTLCRGTSSTGTGCGGSSKFTSNSTGGVPAGANFSWSGPSGWLSVSQGPYSANFIDSAEFNVTSASLAVSPDTGPPGTIVTLSGGSFVPTTTYDYCSESVDQLVGCPATSTFTTTSAGAVPSGVSFTWASGGEHWLAVSEGPDVANFILAAPFTVTNPVLTLAPALGPAGTLVTLTGTGLASNTTYDYCWVTSPTPVGCPGNQTFRSTLIGDVPAGVTTTRTGGSAWLAVSEGPLAQNYIASGAFAGTVASFQLGPNSGPNRSAVALEGIGLADSTRYDLCWTSAPGPVGCAPALNFTSTSIGTVPGGTLATSPGPGMSWLAVSQGPAVSNYIGSAQFGVTIPTLSLTPLEGPNGTLMGVAGDGFAPSTVYNYCWASSAAAVGCSATENFNSTPIGELPVGLFTTEAAGHPWLAVSQGSSTAHFIVSVEFQVTVAHLSLSPSRGPVHALVTVSGTGLAPNTTYQVCFLATSSSACPASSANFTSDAGGTVPSGVNLREPSITSSKLEVSQNPTHPILSTSFTPTVPTVALEGASGPSNAVTTVTGAGFSANGNVTVLAGGAAVSAFTVCSRGNSTGGTISANANGAFACSFHVPGSSNAGSTPIAVTDVDSGATVNSTFRLTVPDLTLSSVAAAGGTLIYANGSGFDDGGTITLSLAHLQVNLIESCAIGNASGNAIGTSAQGSFSCLVAVPTGAPIGATALVATASPSGATATVPFTVQLAPSGTNGDPLGGLLIPLIAASVVIAAAVVAGVLLMRRRRGSSPGAGAEPAPPEGSEYRGGFIPRRGFQRTLNGAAGRGIPIDLGLGPSHRVNTVHFLPRLPGQESRYTGRFTTVTGLKSAREG